jgi:hypothetical protein
MPLSLTALGHYLGQRDDHAWHRTAGLLEAETHEVDRAAVRCIDTDAPHPWIRLAWQARATGAVSIVIPPWTGVLGAALGAGASQETAAAIAGAR